MVRDLINQIKSSKDPHYCERVTASDGEVGEQHLRAFQDNEKSIPVILTTSQKLSMGVDARNIQHMAVTTFWHADGTPISARQFLELLFGKLPEFFTSEEELRALWGAPETRAELLRGLAEKGFGGEQLAEIQKIVDAEKSDLFDVMAHVAYAVPPKSREERAEQAKVIFSTSFNSRQRVFLDCVLAHYVSEGVEELAMEKLTPLLRLKYHDAIADAVADLGPAEEIRSLFTGFQRHLYEDPARGATHAA